MAKESIAFSPSISDRELDREVSKIDKKLGGVDDTISPSVDSKGISSPGMPGGDGGGGGGTLGGVESKLGGLDSKLGNKLPSPMPGRLAPAAMPIAIAGSVGAGMLSAMHGASARLQTSTSLLGQAWNNVWRPIGDRLDELFIREEVKDIVEATEEFEENVREDGVVSALKEAGKGALEAAWENLLDRFRAPSIEFNEDALVPRAFRWMKDNWPGWPDIDGLWPGWPSINVEWPGWPDLEGLWPGWGSFIDGVEWNTHIAGLRFSHWKQLIDDPNWGGIIEGVTSSDVLGRIAPTLGSRQLVRSIGWPNIGSGHVLGSIDWPSVSSSDILGLLRDIATGGGGSSRTRRPPPGRTTHRRTSDRELYEASGGGSTSSSTYNQGRNRSGTGALMQSGGVLNRGTTITAGEAGPEAIVPFAQLRRMIDNALQAGAESGGGGGGASDQLVKEVRELRDQQHRDMRRLERALPQLDSVSDEGLARVVDEGRKNRVSDTNSLI